MEEPAWNLLKENLPEHLRTAPGSAVSASHLVFTPGKVTVRGLGVLKAKQQLENLISFLNKMRGALPKSALV